MALELRLIRLELTRLGIRFQPARLDPARFRTGAKGQVGLPFDRERAMCLSKLKEEPHPVCINQLAKCSFYL